MEIKIKKIHEDAVIPKYQTPGASGFDLHALEDVEIFPGETKLVRTGLAVEIPFGFEIQVRPRSGLSLKTPLRVANAPGSIDADYRGELCVIVWNSAETVSYTNLEGETLYPNRMTVKKGERIAQGVVAPVIQAQFVEVDLLSDTERGVGGFGSTGAK